MLKKTRLIIGLILLLTLSTGLMAVSSEQPPLQTPGDPYNATTNPYVVSTLGHLSWIAQNASGWVKSYIQSNDIDASQTQYWDDNDGNNNGDLYDDDNDATSTGNNEGFSPIGNGINKLSGSYDGNGHTISNLFIDRTVTYLGLFGYTSGAAIQNLSVTNVDITATSNYVSGLAGYILSSTVSNCYSTGTVSGGGNYYAALVGCSNNSIVSNCYSNGTVSSSSQIVGGLVGYNQNSTVTNCYSTGTVNGNSNVGGLVGFNNSTVTNSFWDTQTSGQTSSDGGTGKSTAEMKDVATFTDYTDGTDGLDTPVWDFVGNPNDDAENNDIWTINASYNNGYPYLVDNPTSEVPTPITLVFFTAKQANGQVTLNWQTETETNNAAFLVYRNDEAIARIDGAGTTTKPHSYTYIDATVIPSVGYTYVLADVDYANTETKYDDDAVTVSIDNNIPEVNFIVGAAYPNPFNPMTVIPLTLTDESLVNASLYDLAGHEVKSLINTTMSAGNHVIFIDGSDLMSGIYMVKISIGNMINMQKIVYVK